MNREQQLLVEAEARREREAYEQLGRGLFDKIEEARNANGPVDGGLPDSTLELLGVKAASLVPEDASSSEASEEAPATPSSEAAPGETLAGVLVEEPMPLAVARLELARGVNPAEQSHLSLEDRIANLETSEG